MKQALLLLGLSALLFVGKVQAQEKIGGEGSKLSIGGYGTIDYTKPVSSDYKQNGTFDVSRIVLMVGYQFTNKTSFVSEIEFEHVKELWIEQAFLNHRFDERLQLRAGLMLVPFGIVNENHEPTTFNGVLRPAVDQYIIPTTWREIGVGVHGRFSEVGIGYQLYAMNGFKSFDGGGLVGGSSGLRGGRQKGAKGIGLAPNIAARVTYEGIPNLVLGVSGYVGESSSTLFNKVDKNNTAALAKADSSVVNVAMVGFDYRYQLGNFKTRGTVAYASLGNTAAYNALTKKDLGSSLLGYYIEGSYELFAKDAEGTGALTPFVRFEKYNTNNTMAANKAANPSYNRRDIVVGLGYRLTKGSVIKADYTFSKSKADASSNDMLSLGVGVTF